MTINEELEFFFSKFGVTLEEARNRLKNLYLDGRQSATGLLSLYFSMASLVLDDVKNILELGTGLGERTIVLSVLFPMAKIYTFDLPKSDGDFNKVAWRGLKKKKDRVNKFKRNIDRENIVYKNSNSFFLFSLGLPKEFELILVDGGHTYPAVAWDIMFSYSHLRENGFMFMHDYTVGGGVLKVRDVVEYMAKRIDEKVWYFPGSLRLEENKRTKTPCVRKGDCREMK